MKKNIALVGFMGAGKSAVGKVLAKRLAMDFVDLDAAIEEKEKRSIAQIFEESGEPYFRRIEKEVVKEFSGKEGQVLACGGGVVMDEENMARLKQSANLVYLKTSPEIILKRTQSYQHRPLLNVPDPKKKIEELLKIREPFYARADFTVDTSDKEIREIVEEILKRFAA